MPGYEAAVEWTQQVTAKHAGYNLVDVKGTPSNPTFRVTDTESLIDTFKAGDSDCFVCSFVRGGCTWTQMILKLLLNKGVEDGRPYPEVVPWLEALTSDTLAQREAPGHSIESVTARLGQPRYFKTHAPVAHLPGSLDSGAKVIYVARNPKDTAISLYCHAQDRPEFGYIDEYLSWFRGFEGDMDTFLRLFLAGRAENGCWFSHVINWYQASVERPDQVLFLHYEDMVDNPGEAIRRIARFIGRNDLADDNAVVEKVVAGSSITSMRSNKAANLGMGRIRNGGYGGWRAVFTWDQNRYFDAIYAQHMKGSTLQLRFE